MFHWFIFRRLHSLTGLGLTLFLVGHLYVNSKAALPLQEGSSPYIHAVNELQDITYLPVIELLLLGLPILIHTIWGIVYLRTGRYGFVKHDGSAPLMPYPGHYGYVLQRVTAWVLLVGIAVHVLQMRFLDRPVAVEEAGRTHYEVSVVHDESLHNMALKLPVKVEPSEGLMTVETKDFGTAEWVLMRQTFQSPGWILLYTLFVLAAAYHAFQGLWTFLLSWGLTISLRSQRLCHAFSMACMCLVAFMGLVAIFGTYWMHGR